MGITRRKITVTENFEDEYWIATAGDSGLCYRHTDPGQAVTELLALLGECGDWPDAKEYYALTSGT